MYIIASVFLLSVTCLPMPKDMTVLKPRQGETVFKTVDKNTVTYKKVPTKWVKTTKKSN